MTFKPSPFLSGILGAGLFFGVYQFSILLGQKQSQDVVVPKGSGDLVRRIESLENKQESIGGRSGDANSYTFKDRWDRSTVILKKEDVKCERLDDYHRRVAQHNDKWGCNGIGVKIDPAGKRTVYNYGYTCTLNSDSSSSSEPYEFGVCNAGYNFGLID